MLENTDLQLETQNDFKEEQVSENAQDFEVVEYNHPVHGLFEVEVDTGLSDDQIKKVVGNLDLDLLLGLEQVNETEVGETQVEKLKEFENSAGAGRKDGKWYGHESLEGGTQTIAYGHKLTPEEAKSGFISINGELVDYRQGLSQDHAEAVLKADTQWAQTHASASLKKIGMEDDEGKLQAITSLIYNVGSGSWGSSKAKKFLEAGNIEDFMHEAFSEEAGFVNINGEYSRGLARRRKEEAGLFAQANINEGSPFSKMISEVLNTINPISTAQAADDPKGLPLPTQDEADAATAAAEPSSKFGTPPVKPNVPVNLADKPRLQQVLDGDMDPFQAAADFIIGEAAAYTFDTPELGKPGFINALATGANSKIFAKSVLGQVTRDLGLPEFIAKGFESDVAGGDVSERLFSEPEISEIRQVVLKKAGDNIKPGSKGYFTYSDQKGGQEDFSYGGASFVTKQVDPAFSAKGALGSASYEIDERGHIIVSDIFNSNDGVELQEANPTYADRWKNLRDYAEGKLTPEKPGAYGVIRRFAALFGSPGSTDPLKDTAGPKFKIDLGPAIEDMSQ